MYLKYDKEQDVLTLSFSTDSVFAAKDVYDGISLGVNVDKSVRSVEIHEASIRMDLSKTEIQNLPLVTHKTV
jgi:hypothetical protein